MKKILALLLSLLVPLSMAACATAPQQAEATAAPAAEAPTEAPATEVSTEASTPEPQPEARSFTDSLGRQVELPAQLDKVALSGSLSQIVLFAICPDTLVGIATKWDESAAKFFDAKYYDLPLLGQLYGGKGELNLEALLASEAQVVIDVGEQKKNMTEDLDALQEQTGIPFVHIDAYTASVGETYRILGKLLNMPEEANALADYCEATYARILDIANKIEKKRLLYVSGEGQHVIAQGSFHAEIIDLLADNLAVVDDPSSKGTGNEVSMEQILAWDPDYVIFAPGSIYSTVKDDPAWAAVTAIKEGQYYQAPFGPYNWMGFPPSVQRYLGMLWMAKTLYPEAADYDLYEEVKTYFRLFYHCDLTQEQFNELASAA